MEQIARTNHDSLYWLDGKTGKPVTTRHKDTTWWTQKKDYPYPMTIEIMSTPNGGGNSPRYNDEWLEWLIELNNRHGQNNSQQAIRRLAAVLFNRAANSHLSHKKYVELGDNPKAEAITTGSGYTVGGVYLANYVKIIGDKQNNAYPIETLCIKDRPPNLDEVNPDTHRWLFCLGTSIDNGKILAPDNLPATGYAPNGYPTITWWPLLTKERVAFIRAEKVTIGVSIPTNSKPIPEPDRSNQMANKGFIAIVDNDLGVHVLRESTDPERYQNIIDVAFTPQVPPDPKPVPEPDQLTLLWPTVEKRVTQRFGVNAHIYSKFGLPAHGGLDLAAPMDSKLFAVTDMKCSRVDTQTQHPSYGWSVRFEFKHAGFTYEVTYAHLIRPAKVRVGDVVQRGAVIGFADSTGNSTGSHLHIMLKKFGATARKENVYNGVQWPFDIVDVTPYFAELR